MPKSIELLPCDWVIWYLYGSRLRLENEIWLFLTFTRWCKKKRKERGRLDELATSFRFLRFLHFCGKKNGKFSVFSFSQCRWARAKKLILLQHRVQHRILGQRSTFLSPRSFSFDNKSLCWNWHLLDYIWSDIRFSQISPFISSFPVLISFSTTEASLCR